MLLKSQVKSGIFKGGMPKSYYGNFKENEKPRKHKDEYTNFRIDIN